MMAAKESVEKMAKAAGEAVLELTDALESAERELRQEDIEIVKAVRKVLATAQNRFRLMAVDYDSVRSWKRETA